MRINTNIPALNTHRMMGITNRSAAKNLEKLSSGKRLNRSSDDAAGLAISEKMEAQIRGLRMASKNSLDGMSLIQTAEGALNEVHAMLQRMRELSVYAATDSVVKEDREAIQSEINQLTSEVNKIGTGTEFNKLSLLKGNVEPKSNVTVFDMTTGSQAEFVIKGLKMTGFNPNTKINNLRDTEDMTININGKSRTVNFDGFGSGELSYVHLLERINDALGKEGEAYFDDEGNIFVKTKSAGSTENISFHGATSTLNKLFGHGLNEVENIIGEEKRKGSLEFDLKEPLQAGDKIRVAGVTITVYADTAAMGTDLKGIALDTDVTVNQQANKIKTLLTGEFVGIDVEADFGTVRLIQNVAGTGVIPKVEPFDKLKIGEEIPGSAGKKASMTFEMSKPLSKGDRLKVAGKTFTAYADAASAAADPFGIDASQGLNAQMIEIKNKLDAAMNTTHTITALTATSIKITENAMIAQSKIESPRFIYSAAGKEEDSTKRSSGTILLTNIPEHGSFMKVGNKKIEFYDSDKGTPSGTNDKIDVKGKTKDQIIQEIAGLDFSAENTTVSAVAGNKHALKVQFNDTGLQGNHIELEGTTSDFRVALQVGANERQYFQLGIGDCRAIALNIAADKPTRNPKVSGAAYVKVANVIHKNSSAPTEYAIDVTEQEKASAAIEVYDNAIVQVSKERARMGAIQNRLEKTIANLDNTAENLTAAKSRIADTDMALEMSEFSKLNIMQQAGTAMLAQANQQPQLMLKLLNA